MLPTGATRERQRRFQNPSQRFYDDKETKPKQNREKKQKQNRNKTETESRQATETGSRKTETELREETEPAATHYHFMISKGNSGILELIRASWKIFFKASSYSTRSEKI